MKVRSDIEIAQQTQMLPIAEIGAKLGVKEEDLELLKQTLNIFVFEVLGLINVSKEDSSSDKLSGAVEILINLRKEARLNKLATAEVPI